MSWKKFLRRRNWDKERARELEAYLDTETAENMACGMSAEDARAAAHRKLGNTTRVREEIYQMNSLGFIETLWQDIRYGARMLRKSPGFTITAVLTLALGIGANTAIFSMVDWLILQQLPVERPKELTYLGFSLGGALHNDSQFSFPEYQQMNELSGKEFAAMSAVAFGGSGGEQSGPDGMTYQGKTLPVQTFFVTGNFFSLLELKPALGRFFTPEEGNTAGGDPVVVLAWEYWQSRFHGDPEIIGRMAAINGHPVTVIGVAPKGFVGPTPVFHMQAYLPLGMLVIDAGTSPAFLSTPDARSLTILARLKRGADAEKIKPALAVVGKRLLQQWPRPDQTAGNGATGVPNTTGVLHAIPLRPPGILNGEGSSPLVKVAAMFLTLGILVLLLACLNVANLLLVRATARQGEIAVRAALGAARSRLVRQLLTESLLLAFLGCAGGILTGLAATQWIAALHFQTSLTLFFDLRLNWHVFALAFFIALLAGILVGIIPALRISQTGLNAVLHESQRTVSGGKQRLRNVLVVAEVAGALSLLIVAGLFIRSMQGVEHADLGFDPGQVTNFTLDPNQIGYAKDKGMHFYQTLLERARALPGVESASLAAMVPMGDTEFGGPIQVPGIEPVKGQPASSALYNAVSPDYFQTMRIPLIQGRDLSDRDSATAPRVALINQAMAEKYWPKKDPLGLQFSEATDPNHPIQIVGVVRNFRMIDPYSPIEPTYFVPLTQHYFPRQVLQLRTARDASPTLSRDIMALVDQLEPSIPVYGGMSMTEALNGLNGLFVFRLAAALTGTLGGLGLILAAVGVYGVMSYSIRQRTREIGIRMALGAQRRQILSLVGRQGFFVVLAGLFIGLLLAVAVSQLIRDFLVGIGPTDAVTYITISLLLTFVAMAACFIPARLATKADPMIALRRE